LHYQIYFCFNDGKSLADFSGSQKTKNRAKKGIVKVFLSHIFTIKYMMHGNNMPAIKKRRRKRKVRKMRPRKLNHVLGRFWGRYFTVTFRHIWTKQATQPMVKAIISTNNLAFIASYLAVIPNVKYTAKILAIAAKQAFFSFNL